MPRPSLPATIALLLLPSVPASAAILPYAVRTRDYSAWTPSMRGDISTVGMAGATLALPTSISAAEVNPAGFAMLTGSVSAQINKTSLNDSRIQHNKDPIEASQWGLSVSPAPWAYSLAYYSPMSESGIYVSPNTGDTVKTEVSLKELRFTVGRAFFDGALALGVSAELEKAVRELDDFSSSAYGLSFRSGALMKLPGHFLIGAAFTPQISVGPAAQPDAQTILPGFNRAVILPLQAGLGLGWIPSRYFRAGFSLTYVGSTENTALLADESIATGSVPTWVPRLGATYVLIEVRNFKVEAAAGSYFEISRLQDQSNRLHVTAGVEAQPYFVNLGAGLDVSSGYQNLIVSVGVDVVRTLRSFDIIPKDSTPVFDGTLPPVYGALPPSAVRGQLEAPAVTSPPPATVKQVGTIIENVPENIAKKIMGEKTTVEVKESKDKRDEKLKQRRAEKRLERQTP